MSWARTRVGCGTSVLVRRREGGVEFGALRISAANITSPRARAITSGPGYVLNHSISHTLFPLRLLSLVFDDATNGSHAGILQKPSPSLSFSWDKAIIIGINNRYQQPPPPWDMLREPSEGSLSLPQRRNQRSFLILQGTKCHKPGQALPLKHSKGHARCF